MYPDIQYSTITVVRVWQQLRYPSTGEWIKKMRSMYTVECDSAIKRNKTGSFVVMWINIVCHTEWSKSEKEKQISYIKAQTVKNLPAMEESRVRSLGQEVPLEKEMATHSRILAWETAWTEEPGRLHPMGLQRVRHD